MSAEMVEDDPSLLQEELQELQGAVTQVNRRSDGG